MKAIPLLSALSLTLVVAIAILFYRSPFAEECVATNPVPITNTEIVDGAPPSTQVYYLVLKYTKNSVVTPNHAFRCAHEETSYNSPVDLRYDPSSKKNVSSANAVGIFQILPIAAREVWGRKLAGMTDEQIRHKLRYDEDFNVHTYVMYVEFLYKKFHSWPKVYSVYNQGWKGASSINSYATRITGGG